MHPEACGSPTVAPCSLRWATGRASPHPASFLFSNFPGASGLPINSSAARYNVCRFMNKAAFYDLDGTLLSCNLVTMHAYYARNDLSLIHISEPTRLLSISYAV